MYKKIFKDPFYKQVYLDNLEDIESVALDALDEAGYFETKVPYDNNIKDSIDLLCTPITFLADKLATSKNPAVLVLTGSMCPIHDGHLSMMSVAREALEKNGYDVIGGYIAPDHDEYINEKTKHQAINIHHRIKFINDQIKNIDWLAVDPWAGIFNNQSIIFTDIIYHLELYLEKYLERNVPVFFVCGGDNARFALTFKHRGHCVVVNRPSYEASYNYYKNSLKDLPNIIWAAGNNSNSSTQIRNSIIPKVTEISSLALRIDSDNTDLLVENIISILPFKDIIFNDIKEQKEDLKTITGNIISLDSILEYDFKLEISRHYDFSGIKFISHGNRPGSNLLAKQIHKIPAGKYYLLDDDIATGRTMQYAENELIKADIEILGRISLNNSKSKNTEILDIRDFLLDNVDGGLVIKLPNGKITRSPYIYPFVCPYQRGSIINPIEFSIKVWEFNLTRFLDSAIRLGQLYHIKDLLNFSGFNDDSLMEDICYHYINKLKKLV